MKVFKVGITGQEGFIGSHLYNGLSVCHENFELIEFKKRYFDDDDLFDKFVRKCDVIVHLAAVNRHNNPELIYDVNIELVSKLVASLKRTRRFPHVILSSSSQEDQDNVYGRSKKEGREALSEWSKANGAVFTGLIIPNVFGPFGKPKYNSVVATFCDQLVKNKNPKVLNDSKLGMIYISELVEIIKNCILQTIRDHEYKVKSSYQVSVSELLKILTSFRRLYLESGQIPSFKSTLELNLFNTFRSYLNLEESFPKKYTQHNDERGSFVELIRAGVGGQSSFSTTHPGITRGNHFHTRKIERFSVIKGKALVQLRRVGTKITQDFYLDGSIPSYVDMPIWYTHNIKNIGDVELITLFWINEPYDPEDPDTYFLKV
tara:strand:+ start:1853 stop:2977 length:1125 start_codon:yes stop_codon:yes gene_type:complete